MFGQLGATDAAMPSQVVGGHTSSIAAHVERCGCGYRTPLAAVLSGHHLLDPARDL